MEIYVIELEKRKYYIGCHFIPDRDKYPGKDFYLPNHSIVDHYKPLHINEICDFNINILQDLILKYYNKYGIENVTVDI